MKQTAERPGLIFANFTLTCDCSVVNQVSFIGLHDNSIVACTSCDDTLPFNGEMFDEMYEQFRNAVIALFGRSGLSEPNDQIVEFIQKYNRIPMPEDLRKTDGYAVGLVAEEFYQPAVLACSVGEEVKLFKEIGNPHDPDAIVAVDPRGEVIGYIARKNFVYRVMNVQDQGCSAKIFAFRDERGCRDVILDLHVDDAPTATRAYAR